MVVGVKHVSNCETKTNLDWAGIVLERATGMTLDAYLQKNVFAPLDIKNISMFPHQEMKSNLASMHQRWHNGHIEERDHVLRRGLNAQTDEEKARVFNSGGAGCFAKPVEYVRKSSVNHTRRSRATLTDSYRGPCGLAERWHPP